MTKQNNALEALDELESIACEFNEYKSRELAKTIRRELEAAQKMRDALNLIVKMSNTISATGIRGFAKQALKEDDD